MLSKMFRYSNIISAKHILFGLLVVFLFSVSCTPPRKLRLLQDKTEMGDTISVQVPTYRLKPGDILHIHVDIANPDAKEIYNKDFHSFYVQHTDLGDPTMYVWGYYIDPMGFTEMPELGKVRLGGLTVQEARDQIQEKVDEHLIGASVSVRLINFSVTVMGEVAKQGNYKIFIDNPSILDVIGLAGGFTDYGNRNVRIIRRIDGTHYMGSIDLTDRQAFLSEFYYLQPNDIIYVDQLSVKTFRSENTRTMLSAISVASSIIWLLYAVLGN